MIEFVSITKEFQNNFWEKKFYALDNISFKINQGDMIGFLGANGAGKTTLIKSLLDFSRPTAGEIKFSSILGKNSTEIKSQIGYLPERAYLYQHLTGREFLQFAGKLNSLDKVQLPKLIKEWSEKIQIDHALDRQIRSYSKGMQQRLGFISALMHNPQLLVLDEPLSGLDPVGRRDFKKILKELNGQGTTIFFSSHIVSDVEELCNRVIFIEKGKLVYEGSIEDLVSKNSSELYTIAYLKNGASETISVDEKDKNKALEKLIRENCTILSMNQDTQTLEEIIYKIKK